MEFLGFRFKLSVIPSRLARQSGSHCIPIQFCPFDDLTLLKYLYKTWFDPKQGKTEPHGEQYGPRNLLQRAHCVTTPQGRRLEHLGQELNCLSMGRPSE